LPAKKNDENHEKTVYKHPFIMDFPIFSHSFAIFPYDCPAWYNHDKGLALPLPNLLVSTPVDSRYSLTRKILGLVGG
jgi:hypothetical protein